MMENYTDREAWLTEGADQMIATFAESDNHWHDMPLYRVSVGYAPRHRGGKVAGVCINAEASSDNHFEVFINPVIDDGLQALEVLAHELVHVVDRMESGHKGRFARLARRIGLEGKLTATNAGEGLTLQIQDVLSLLGDYPHGSIDIDFTKKQSTRMLKVCCGSCDFHFRTSRKNVLMLDMDTAPCPACEQTDSLFVV